MEFTNRIKYKNDLIIDKVSEIKTNVHKPVSVGHLDLFSIIMIQTANGDKYTDHNKNWNTSPRPYYKSLIENVYFTKWKYSATILP